MTVTDKVSAPEDEQSAWDAPPRPDQDEPKAKPERKRERSTSVVTKATLREGFDMIGRVWEMREVMDKDHPQPSCGAILRAQSDEIAEQLYLLSRTNKSVKKWLEGMLSGGGWFGVAFAVYPVIAAVRQNHVMPALEARRQAAEEMFGSAPDRIPAEGDGSL